MDKYIERLLEIEQRIYKRGIEIQNKYGFEIPDYVLYEIVKSEKDKNNIRNIIQLINLAMINKRILLKDASILIKDIRSREIYE